MNKQNKNFTDEDMMVLEESMRSLRRELDNEKERLEERLEMQDTMEKAVSAYSAKCDECEALQEELDAAAETIRDLHEQIATLKMQISEMGKLANKVVEKSAHEDLLPVVRKYLNISKKKTAKKKGYIRMMVLEMLSTSKVEIPEDLQETLDSFDDEENNPSTVNNYYEVGNVSVQKAVYVKGGTPAEEETDDGESSAGRSKTFADCIADGSKRDDVMKRLHQFLDGKRNKEFAKVIVCAVEAGLLVGRPSYELMTQEFGDIGSKSTVNKFITEAAFTDDEKIPIVEALKQ